MFSKGKGPNFSPLTHLDSRFCDFPNLSVEVVFRPLLRFVTISGVIELHFKRGWSRWKDKTWGYKSSREENPGLPPRHSKLLINESYLLPYRVYHDSVLVGDS